MLQFQVLETRSTQIRETVMPRLRWKISLFVFSAIVLLALGYVYRPVVPSAHSLLHDGQMSLRNGDLAKVDPFLEQLVAAGYTEHAALLRGESLYRRQKFGQAESELAKVNGTSELYPQAAAFFAYCRLEAGDAITAQKLLHGVLEDHPNDVEAHRGLAQVYFTLGANTRVVDELELVAKLDPSDTRPWMYKGGFYADVGLLVESVDAYEQALSRAVKPEQIGRARLGLAEALLKFGQHDRAMEVLAGLPMSFQKDSSAIVFKADALLRLGELKTAKELIASVVADLSPSSAALTIAGRIEFEAGDYERALKLFERATVVDAAYHEAHYHMAQTLNRMGNTAAGAAQQKRADAIKADLQLMSQLMDGAGMRPWDSTVRDKIADVSRRLGKEDIAIKWTKAAKMCPPPPKR